MRSVRFLKEPGYTFDLFFIFTLYFNKKYCLSRFINYKKSADDMRFFEKVIEEFGPIPDELLVFFYLKNNPKAFMSAYYFDPYIAGFLDGEYNLATVQTALSNYDQVIDNVLHFYFKEETEETIQQCKESLVVANSLIMKSDYEPRVKTALYSFLIDPVRIIHCLSHELMTKEFALSKQYEKNYQKLSSLQEKFDFTVVATGLKSGEKQSVDISSFNNVLVTFCYNHKNHVKTIYYDDTVLVVLGADYVDALQYLQDTKYSPKLHDFGLALAEVNRVAILKLIHERGEITIKELEQTLDMAGTNAYYHLSLMIRSGLLKTRNRGRTVLYSVDRHYFEILSNVIKSYSEEREETL